MACDDTFIVARKYSVCNSVSEAVAALAVKSEAVGAEVVGIGVVGIGLVGIGAVEIDAVKIGAVQRRYVIQWQATSAAHQPAAQSEYTTQWR
jgi:hypothetical protein